MPVENPDDYLSSGSTLLNLALTDDPYCAFLKGTYNFIVGDSMAGKSYFAGQLFAEACHDSGFDDYKLVHDDPEDGMLMDIAEHFGESTKERIEAPNYTEDGDPLPSQTVEEFYSTVKGFFKQPCIDVLDSMDALTSLAEMKKSDKIAKAIDEDREEKGIMSDGKAKVNSMMLRQLMRPMQSSGSILFIISQTRDAVGNMFTPKTRSGGKALRFYATTELWFSVRSKMKKKVNGIDREIGSLVQISIKKNRHSSQRPTVEIPLIHDYGFDDVGSCIDYLVTNKHWTGKSTIACPEFSDRAISRAKLIAHIEEKESRQEKLKKITGKVWNEIRSQMKPKRKKKY